MTVSAQVNQRNVRAFEKRLERFLGEMANPTPANRQASIQLYGWCIRNFDSEGSLVGRWMPLAESTVLQKRRLGKEKMLVRSGNLRSGFTPFYSRENAGVSNDVEYAVYHHEGTDTIPSRELLPPRSIVLRIGLDVYGTYVARAAKRANR
jgi:phage gpG-like protein